MGIGFRLLLVLVGGTMLSLSMELAQYYDAGRVTSADDVYANVLGTITGGLGGIYLSGRWQVPLIAEISAKPLPAALLAAWAGYRLYPYVPTIDLHKYWDAVKPVIYNPTLSLDGLYRHTTIWLAAFALISLLFGSRRSVLLAPLFCGCALVARMLIIDTELSISDVTGASVALCLWPIMLIMPHRRRAAVLFILLGTAVIVERLQPFQFLPVARNFEWVPFHSLMMGSIGVNVMAFCEKSFLYGTLLLLFTEAGRRLRTAVVIVGGAVFATSWVQTYLPSRSADITDLLMVLLLAGGIALLNGPQQTA
jgi:VanZ family protein